MKTQYDAFMVMVLISLAYKSIYINKSYWFVLNIDAVVEINQDFYIFYIVLVC